MTGTWQGLTNQPGFNTSTMILLTDGRVMVQEEAQKHWHALTPDANGSYLNGTWTTLKDMSFWRRYYASGVLKDGRVIVLGGEQSGDAPDTNKGEIYDPVSDTWSPIPTPPGWPIVGDAASCILPDGRLMIGALTSPACIIYDPVTNSWTPAASKAVRSNEETWVLLPDNTIVTTQCWDPYQSEKYIISSNTWKPEGALPARVVDPVMHETGPAMLMYNGKVIFFGSANEHGRGKTVIYTPPAFPTGTGAWAAGPDIPRLAIKRLCPTTVQPRCGRTAKCYSRRRTQEQRLGITSALLRVRPRQQNNHAGARAAEQWDVSLPAIPGTLLEPDDAPPFRTSPFQRQFIECPVLHAHWRSAGGLEADDLCSSSARLSHGLLPLEGHTTQWSVSGEYVRRRLLAGD